MIALEDLKDYTEKEVINHLATSYSGENSGFDYGEINESDIEKANVLLKNMEVLIAYESVGGNWGCDSSSFFLLKDKITNKLYEIHGSHCSCYGFEGQLDLEETTSEALKFRNKQHYGIFYTGGYDDNEKENLQKVHDFIEQL